MPCDLSGAHSALNVEVLMSDQESTPAPMQDPEGPLEQALIAEYLRMQRHDSRSVARR